MTSTGLDSHPIMMWLLIAVSVLLVAGITYVYTNRNARITLLFTLLSILSVGILKIVSIVDLELGQHYIGVLQGSDNTVAVTAGPGWSLLFHAWHIWLLPVMVVSIIFAIVIYLAISYRKSDGPKLEVRPTLPGSSSLDTTKSEQTRSERLNAFMMVDAAKKETRVANQKLTESLLMNAANEIKITELNTQITSLESDLEIIRRAKSEQLDTLHAELDKKDKEYEELNQRFLTVTQDLDKAKVLLKKFADLHKKKPEPL